jgi:hypothetical protein
LQDLTTLNFYYKGNIHKEMQVVKIQVDLKVTKAAGNKLSDAFFDPDFLEKK